MRLVTVGTSGSMSGPGAPAATHLVQATDADGRTWHVVLDLGPGGLGRLMEHVDPRDVDALFFSHLHPDHMADVTSLQVYLRYHPEGESGPLPTWGPEQTAERIAAICWMEDLSEVERQFDVRRHEAGRVVEIGPLRIQAAPVRHPVPAFGLRIEGPSETPGRTATMVYTGDTDACPELGRLADGVDLLLAEASFQEGREDMIRGIHLTGRRAGELAAALAGGEWDEPSNGGTSHGDTSDGDPVTRRPVGRLVLTHLPPWTDPAVVSTEAREVYAGPVEVATSGASWLV